MDDDPWVWLTESKMVLIPRRHGMAHVTRWPGERVRKSYAERHHITYRMTAPLGSSEHPHNTPRPDDGTR